MNWLQASLSGGKFPFRLATSTYVFSFGLNLILGNTYFWDDWQNRITKSEFAAKARLSGFPPTREILEYDILGNSGILFRVVTFLSYFVAAACLHRVLRRGLSLSSTQVNVITLLFLLAPINSTRAAMIIMHYSISFAIFFCAWGLLVAERQSLVFLSLPLFWISFGTPSLLPFFLLPMIHWVLLNRSRFNSSSRILLLVLLVATPMKLLASSRTHFWFWCTRVLRAPASWGHSRGIVRTCRRRNSDCWRHT
jgi:hypothetical protein